jgi:hypothetical protein
MEPKVETCTCLQYIGDNPPCPVHNNPDNPARRYVPPRMTANASHRAYPDEPEPTTPKSQPAA